MIGNSKRTRALAFGIIVTAVACLALPGDVTAQRGESQGRVPFQTHLSVFIANQINQVSRRFVVPVGRRLEIHNVNARLSLSQLPEQFESQCRVGTVGQFGANTGTMPILLKRLNDPAAGQAPSGAFDWHTAQPTLLHAFAGQRVQCVFDRFPVSGFGYIEWTISGFMDDAQ